MIDGPAVEGLSTRWRADPDAGLTIGRGQDARVRLPDASVSRKHAEVFLQDGEWIIRDLGSRHGTVLGNRVLEANQPVPMTHRSELRVGPWAFRVLISGDVSSGVTISAGPESTGRIRRVLPTQMGELAQRRLDLVLGAAERLGDSESEDEIARVIVNTVLEGAGSARAAMVHPGETMEIVASGGGEFELSRSLIEEAARGELVRLESDAPEADFGQSLVTLGIHSACCAPVRVGDQVVAVLYLDARSGESSTMQDAVAFVGAMARICGLALANLSRASLERHRAQLEADLSAARVAQRIMMPPASGQIGAARFAVTSRPGRFVAGDLIGIEPRSEGRVCFYLGDVTGKGAGAAMLMGIAQSYLNAALTGGMTIEAAVTGLNALIAPRIDSGQFISLWIGEYNPATGVLRSVDAGHGYAMLRSPDGSVQLEFDGGDLPVGIDPGVVYTAGETPVRAGSSVLLFSDGLIEQPAPDGDRFGIERVQAMLADGDDPADLLARLEQAVLEFARGDVLDDDLTIAGLRLG